MHAGGPASTPEDGGAKELTRSSQADSSSCWSEELENIFCEGDTRLRDERKEESKWEGERDISATRVVKERRRRYLLAVRAEESGPLDRPFMTGAPACPCYATGTRSGQISGKNEGGKRDKNEATKMVSLWPPWSVHLIKYESVTAVTSKHFIFAGRVSRSLYHDRRFGIVVPKSRGRSAGRERSKKKRPLIS